MEHVSITKIGDYFRMIPDKGYLLKNKITGATYSEVITSNTNHYTVVEA